jgi:hydroxymethylbilane synthase
MAKQQLRIGTRASQLALWQANWVKSELEQRYPDLEVSLVKIKTTGDKILDVPLARVGGKGLFTKEIEEAMLAGEIEVAVHSMKDVPTFFPAGLGLRCITRREDPRDIVILRPGVSNWQELPIGGRVGTSSLRRKAMLLHTRPDLQMLDIRGNVETRLRKVEDEDLDGTVLAAAGLARLGRADAAAFAFTFAEMLPAVGQGALCIEIRDGDPRVGPMVSALDHPATRTVVSGERAFLKRLQGSCQVPIAGHGRLNGENFTLTGLVADVDGSTVIKDRLSGPADSAEQIGIELAEILLSRGADEILKNLTRAAV